MLRPILRIRNLRISTIVSNRYLRKNNNEVLLQNESSLKSEDKSRNLVEEWNVASDLAASFQPKKSVFEKKEDIFKNLGPGLENDYRTRQMKQYHNDELVIGMRNCKTINELLEFIEPQLNQMRPDHLECAYDKLTTLFLERKRVDPKSLNSIYTQMKDSPKFEALLNHTIKLIRELDTSCLVKQFNLFSSIQQNPKSKIVMATLQMIKHGINDLELDEIGSCLFSYYFYRGHEMGNFLSTFQFGLLQVAKIKILSNRFDTDDFDLIISFLKIMTSVKLESSTVVIAHLIRTLSAFQAKLTVNRAIRILAIFRRIKIGRLKSEKDQKLFTELTSKCNLIIYEEISLKSDEKNTFYYVEKVHGTTHSRNLLSKNFNDYRILNVIAPQLINSNLCDKQSVFNLIYNFSHQMTFNEPLMREIYNEIIENENFANSIEPMSSYGLFTKLRLPFVDVPELNRVHFDLMNPKVKNLISYKLNSIKLITDFILTDITDEKLFDYLIYSTGFLDKNTFALLKGGDFERITLVKSYLQIQSNLNDKIKNALDKLLGYIDIIESNLNKKKLIDTQFIRVNNSIQRNVYLSNGIYLGAFGIFDRPTQKLADLSEFESHFHKIDKLNLNDNQELFTFVLQHNLKGDIGQYELNDNYQLKRVLRNFNITPIDFWYDDIKDLNMRDRVNYLAQFAIDTYKTENKE